MTANLWATSDANLVSVMLGAEVTGAKAGFRGRTGERLCYVHLDGARGGASGYGKDFAAAIADALSRLPKEARQ